MTTLVFGVLDLPYADASSYKEVGRRKPGKLEGSLTTGDVAEILEAKYAPFQNYFDMHKPDIAEALADSYAGAAEALMMGAPADLDPLGEATSAIETGFREFLTNQEMDGRVGGVPTQAAQDGASHRFKHPNKKRKERPSFIDTGLYEGSVRVDIEQ